ncbi:flagellar biosynthesis protein FlgM [Leptolyngbya sp. BL0902]|uniref:zinc metallopeptidase n=1 Tax=Leptolyngbya sp. BL0902 TaxID=1115757 RepID=UPI0018E8BAAD|nr:zinc metallopeptidase [Leptolyngbya sp. BL0902]QQE66780.1 flagellar biosynthesis protein FlgM [Leptolyngbya sp. BL0902]
MFFDPIYLVLMIPGMALMFLAQSKVKGTYRRYSQVQSTMGMTGAQVAQTILSKKGVSGIRIEPVAGELTDHYDPSAKAVRLSEGIYNSTSLAAAAVAAHECGHVLQDVEGYKFMNLRAALVPAVNLGSRLGPMLIMAGLILSSASQVWLNLAWVGIFFFAAVLLFHVVTLPVEFDASGRALRLIDELGILQGEENKGAKAVLSAAALTYVATAFYAALNLLYYIMLVNRRR